MKSLAKADLDRQLADLEASVGPVVRAAFGEASPRAGFADELRASLAAPGAPRRESHASALGWLSRRPVWAALTAGLVGLVIVMTLSQKLTREVDARALVNDMQNAVERVPAGQVRHLVTTYTMSPAVQGSSTHRLEQWFGTVDGRPVSRQTGLLGETTVLDASGTGWQTFSGSNQVVQAAVLQHQRLSSPESEPDDTGCHRRGRGPLACDRSHDGYRSTGNAARVTE